MCVHPLANVHITYIHMYDLIVGTETIHINIMLPHTQQTLTSRIFLSLTVLFPKQLVHLSASDQQCSYKGKNNTNLIHTQQRTQVVNRICIVIPLGPMHNVLTICMHIRITVKAHCLKGYLEQWYCQQPVRWVRNHINSPMLQSKAQEILLLDIHTYVCTHITIRTLYIRMYAHNYTYIRMYAHKYTYVRT